MQPMFACTKMSVFLRFTHTNIIYSEKPKRQKLFEKSCLHGVSEDWKLKVRLKDRQGETIVKTTSDKN